MRLLALLAAFLSVSSAIASELADGEYYCSISGAHLGNIRIEGDRYAGPAYDGAYEAEYPFVVADGRVINWGGPLGGISDAGEVVSTVLKKAGGGRIGFDITIRNPRGNFQTISCEPQ